MNYEHIAYFIGLKKTNFSLLFFSFFWGAIAMIRGIRILLGILVGSALGALLYWGICSLATPNDNEWYIPLLVFGLTILTGIVTGAFRKDWLGLWTVFVFPLIAAVAVILIMIALVIIFGIISEFASGSIGKLIVVLGVIAALSAPAVIIIQITK